MFVERTRYAFRAFCWTGTLVVSPEWVSKHYSDGRMTLEPAFGGLWSANITTPIGWMRANRGDWIVERPSGELVVYNDHDFNANFEPAE